MLELAIAMPKVGSPRAGGNRHHFQHWEDSGKSIVNVARFESGDTRSKLEQP
jgi:hypothetical protein